MRTADIPPAAIPLRTYSEVDHLATQFLLGKINLLVLVGRPGLSKSYCFSALVDQHRTISHYLTGKINPFPTYCDLYLHRHKLIVLDDAELLWAERAGRHLLRQLTFLAASPNGMGMIAHGGPILIERWEGITSPSSVPRCRDLG